MNLLKSVGAKESTAVSKNTFAVIVKNKDDNTGKASNARLKNIPIYTAYEFKEAFTPFYISNADF